jgi:pyruvate dehydrogenase complex dehydrogenase (E1) component
MLRRLAREPAPALLSQLKYYSPAVHAASFILPRFAEDAISPHRNPRVRQFSISLPPPLFSRSAVGFVAVGLAAGAIAAAIFSRHAGK